MSKPQSPTRADRLLRIMKRDATKLRAVGLSNLVIGDEEFRGESVIIDGQNLANFGLCSYLALGDDPRLKEAAKDAIDRFGTSYSSTPYYSSLPLYAELRELLIEVFDADVIVSASTTMGHLSALPVLIGSKDLVLVDTQAHTSMVTATQGSMASGVAVLPVPHSDMEALERTINDAEGAERIWYLTDGVYSMYGDVTPAARLVELLDRYPKLHVYCDDAHGFGWAGRHGRGKFLQLAGWHERVVVVVGLAKAFGSLGGAIATRDPELIDLIRLCGPGLMFGGPVPPPNLGASVAAARILLSNEIIERQSALLDRIQLVNRLSDEIGLALVSKDETPIWFHDVGSLDDMIRLLATMKERGFYMNGSAFPAVPYGHAGIRFTVTLDNSPKQIEDLLLTLNETRLELFGETEMVVDLENESAPTEKASG